MKTGMKLSVWHDSYHDTYKLYSPTIGNIVGTSFDTKKAAVEAAEACGATIITEDDIVDVPEACVDGRDLTTMAMWLENCDFECVRGIFGELMYHEACIRKANAADSDSAILVACAMSVSSALALEDIARNLNHGYDSQDWVLLANWKLDQMAKEGVKTVRCDLGSVELAV